MFAKKNDNILLANKEYQVNYRNEKINSLESEKKELQKKLDDFDCAEETKKWDKLFKSLKGKVEHEKENALEMLNEEKQKTDNLNISYNENTYQNFSTLSAFDDAF